MYELIQLTERTYYIKSPTNIGLFRLDEKNVCLIDSGNDKDAGRRIRQVLDANGWQLTAIYNTHANADHIGGNRYLQGQTGCRIYAPGIDCAFTRHPVLEPSFLYGGYPPKDLRHKFLLAQESDAAELTAILMPAAAGISVERVDMALTAENGALKALAFSADSGSLSLRAELTISEGKKAPAVPEAVKSAISGGKTGGKALSEDLFSLIAAWDAALSGDTVSADIAVSADCGPIVLNDTLQYDVERISGQSFSCIRREPLALYFSGDRMCDASGSTSQTDSGKLMDTAGLVELCYRLALNGEVSSRGRGNGTEYTLTLDEDAMREAAQAIAPDTRAQSITYRDGALSMYVEDGTLRSASVRCAGAIHIVVADAEASLCAEVTFVEREVDFPQQVIDALRK